VYVHAARGPDVDNAVSGNAGSAIDAKNPHVDGQETASANSDSSISKLA
jgi:hypothetical protein